MKKDNMISSLQDLQDKLENVDFKELNQDQKHLIKDRFNTYVNFEYAPDENMFIMSAEAFKQFEYYLGMEYEKDDIELKCEIDDNVAVCYNVDNERVSELIDLLEGNNKNEE